MGADVATLGHLNMVEAFSLLPPHQPAGVLDRNGGVLIALTGCPISIFNEVVPIEDDVERDALARAVETARHAGVPWIAQIRSDTQAHLGSELLRLGLEEIEVFQPAMVLTDLPVGIGAPPELEVVRFHGSDDYARYIEASSSVADADPALWRTWFGVGLLDDPCVAALVGFIDGTPVATAIGIRSGEVVGVYGVETAPPARRRGYGWAMTRAAIATGADDTTRLATLQSSEMGFPVYSAHGFKTVFDYRRFADPS